GLSLHGLLEVDAAEEIEFVANGGTYSHHPGTTGPGRKRLPLHLPSWLAQIQCEEVLLRHGIRSGLPSCDVQITTCHSARHVRQWCGKGRECIDQDVSIHVFDREYVSVVTCR